MVEKLVANSKDGEISVQETKDELDNTTTNYIVDSESGFKSLIRYLGSHCCLPICLSPPTLSREMGNDTPSPESLEICSDELIRHDGDKAAEDMVTLKHSDCSMTSDEPIPTGTLFVPAKVTELEVEKLVVNFKDGETSVQDTKDELDNSTNYKVDSELTLSREETASGVENVSDVESCVQKINAIFEQAFYDSISDIPILRRLVKTLLESADLKMSEDTRKDILGLRADINMVELRFRNDHNDLVKLKSTVDFFDPGLLLEELPFMKYGDGCLHKLKAKGEQETPPKNEGEMTADDKSVVQKCKASPYDYVEYCILHERISEANECWSKCKRSWLGIQQALGDKV